MEKLFTPRYLFALIFALIIVYIVNANVDLLFQSRLVESGDIPAQIPVQKHEQGSIATH